MFSYQTTSSPENAVANTSMSPSPSMSFTTRPIAPSKLASIVLSVKFSEPSFSYQFTLLPSNPVAIISMSPSKSRSRMTTPNAPLRSLSIAVELNVGVSLVILVGLLLPGVAAPPEIDKVKSPISRAPLPLSVSYTTSLRRIFTLLLSAVI